MFDIDMNNVVLTSTYVTNDKMPILYVSHEVDEDGRPSWQFHCGNDDYDMDKMVLVSFSNILALDSGISKLEDLPVGYAARRDVVNS